MPTGDAVPVTILTGFLGSGKTTLLDRILRARHGHRIAVIENEYGEAGIDDEILRAGDPGESIIAMSNGCICCTIRDDLVRTLDELQRRRERGAVAFERVIIETTGLADPGPVVQTFLHGPVAPHYRLDAVVTVVDALHAPRQLDEFREAQEQVGFADRILLSKTDLVAASDAAALRRRLVAMNPRAPILRVHFGEAPIDALLDIRAFAHEAALELADAHARPDHPAHDDRVGSFVFRASRPFDAARLDAFLSSMVDLYGPDMLRYKGLLHLDGNASRVIFQGVQARIEAWAGTPWADREERTSVLVFIGRDLPRDLFLHGLECCLAPAIPSVTREAASIPRDAACAPRSA